MKKKEIVIVIIVCMFAILAYLPISFFSKDKKMVTAKNANGDVLLTFNIYEDAYYELEGEYGKFHIEVKDGKCRAINVDCPNHNCEAVGYISPNNPLPIVCLPNNIVVRIDEQD